MRTARGHGSIITWTADHRRVQKRHTVRERFDRERRIAALVRRQPLQLPVLAPRLVEADRRRLTLTFEAVAGAPLGPKYPLDLADRHVAALIGLASATERYRPANARFLRRFDLHRRIRTAVANRDLAPAAARQLHAVAVDDPPAYVFAHGDVSARNVLQRERDGALVLIDWELAGWYPIGWELAFLWLTFADLPDGRARVEAAVAKTRREAWFWRSALLVQLLHLGLPSLRPGAPFREQHEATRDALLARVLAGARTRGAGVYPSAT